MAEELSKLLTAPQVAEDLGVPLSSVYAWARDRRLPCVRIGRHVRFSRRALREWMEAGGTPTGAA